VDAAGWLGQAAGMDQEFTLDQAQKLLPEVLEHAEELPVLMCWLEGEQELCWYHDARYGFAGRRPVPAWARSSP
jgi:hypothetical protein